MSDQNYRKLYSGFRKRAASLLTPEAMAAVEQPAPVDPAMAGGAPAPGGMPAAAPMDPAAMGGAPMPAPAAAPMPAGAPAGAPALDPAIFQDQGFVAFLTQAVGVMVDPASGTVTDPTGAPIPPEMVMQFYQAYQQQAQGAGAAPQGGQPAPADPGAGQPAPDGSDVVDPQVAMLNDFASAVVTAIEAVIQDQISALEKKISAILEKVDTLKLDIQNKGEQAPQEKGQGQEKSGADLLADELARELQQPAAQGAAPSPVLDTLLPKQGSAQSASAVKAGKRDLLDILGSNTNA